MFKWNWISKLGHFKKNEEWYAWRLVVSNHPNNSKFERIYINKKLENHIDNWWWIFVWLQWELEFENSTPYIEFNLLELMVLETIAF